MCITHVSGWKEDRKTVVNWSQSGQENKKESEKTEETINQSKGIQQDPILISYLYLTFVVYISVTSAVYKK